MYFRRIRCNRDRTWALVLQPSKYLFRPRFSDHQYFQSLSPKTTTVEEYASHARNIRKHLLGSYSCRHNLSRNSFAALDRRASLSLSSNQLRDYSSESDGRNASEDKHVHVNDGTNFDKGQNQQEKFGKDVKYCNAHARLGEQEQEEWLNNERLTIEIKRRESPFLTRRDNENTKNLLVECATSHLRHNKFASTFGTRLSSSSGRILLQSIPGTELYRERLVRALAQDLQVPLLVLDSSILAPYDIDDDDLSSDYESDDDNAESGEDGSLESENEDHNEASNEEEWASSTEAKSDASDNEDAVASAEAHLKKVKAAVLRKLVPYNVEEFEKIVAGESESSESSESSKPNSNDAKSSDKSGCQLKKGDRVKYIGPSVQVTDEDRIILGKIPTSDGPTNAYTIIHGRWVVKDIENDLDTQSQDCYIAVEALCEVLRRKKPLIVYFPDSSHWLHKSVPKSNRNEFFHKVEEMFDQLSGPIVLICGQNKIQSGSKEKEQFTMILPNFGRVAKLIFSNDIDGQVSALGTLWKSSNDFTQPIIELFLITLQPLSLKRWTEGIKGNKTSEDDEINKLFSNVLSIDPPKDENQLATFKKQLEEDKKIVTLRSNLNVLRKVLEEHQLSCMDLLHVNTDGIILTKHKAEKVVGWAKNHYLSSCLLPSVKGERLCLPSESLEIAVSRLMGHETMSRKPTQSLKNLAKDEFESNFISSVVPPGEIGVKFDDIGALEDVKKALNELVILPMRRPELFSRGNLLRPCKGILLFGPPGTGKTLLAKALATEAGANFISITGSTLTSKWFGDAEKLTKALFSFASKLAPVIIFVDEVDSLLGARGGAFEHEATRRMRNEFMAAWDGLRSKENQRILILGATNRPFDLDDAVIRRLPRRIYVDLPDAENRMKILSIFLAQENLDSEFQFDKLANLTDGYSGSDLKSSIVNLCIAAAYRPVQELLEEEKKLYLTDENIICLKKFDFEGADNGTTSVLRPLNLDDFVQSKSKVGPSVAYHATSMTELRKWNEMYGEGGSRTKSPFGFGS
ncbi:unnamed protein product [Sphenostylis stenocarpa]|uniref:AAA+ ATPase domain-containing protein n=1 Tax=Sphenostylis stenocarpa TaxID=92480 RepID=A0AA86SM46_9FABA|nr:unnamed protein product [Sphenostylis stenocarpa]